MSLQPSSPPVPAQLQTSEQLPWKRIFLAAAGALGLFALGVAFALWLQNDVAGSFVDGAGQPVPALAGAPQVGIVEQRIVEAESRAQRPRQDAEARLSRYGWVDRPQRIVHVPIEAAMRAVSEGQR